MPKEDQIKSYLKTLYHQAWNQGTISGKFPKHHQEKMVNAVYILVKDWIDVIEVDEK